MQMKILPVIENGDLLLLSLKGTKDTKEYLNELQKKYNEILKINYQCNYTLGSEDQSHILSKNNADEILVVNELSSKVKKIEASRQVRVSNEDGLWNMCSHHYETEYYTKEITEKLYEIELLKKSFLVSFMNSYTFQGLFENEYAKLSLINSVITQSKNDKLTEKELLLTSKEILENFYEFFQTLEIEDIREYFKVKNVSININSGEIKKEKISMFKYKKVSINNKINVTEEKEKILSYLNELGLLKYARVKDNEFEFLNYTPQEEQIAIENEKLLNNELKVLKKAIIR